jgi:hypothetical protein
MGPHDHGKTVPRNHEGHPGCTVDDSSSTSGISPLLDQSIAKTGDVWYAAIRSYLPAAR